MRTLRVIFKILAFVQWLAACGSAVFATVTAVDFFNQFGAQDIPPIGGEAAVLMAQLLILTGYVLALFLCLSALYCDNVVARRESKSRMANPLSGGEPRVEADGRRGNTVDSNAGSPERQV